MKSLRLLQSVLLALVVGLSLAVATPTAGASEPLPERYISTKMKAKNWRTHVLTGKVQDHSNGRVLIQKKTCRKCKWKTVRKLKTNDNTWYRTKIHAPKRRNQGTWWWRVQVNKKDGYARSRSRKIALRLR